MNNKNVGKFKCIFILQNTRARDYLMLMLININRFKVRHS